MFLIDGAYHVLFGLAQLCEKYGENRLNLEFAKGKIPEAINLVADVVKKEQELDESFSFNRFFKDAKTKVKLAAYIQSNVVSV